MMEYWTRSEACAHDVKEKKTNLPAIARDLPAIAMCAVIPVARRAWRWQAGILLHPTFHHSNIPVFQL